MTRLFIFVLAASALTLGCASSGGKPVTAEPKAGDSPLEKDPAVKACIGGDVGACFQAKEILHAPGADPEVAKRLHAQFVAGCDKEIGADCMRAAVLTDDPEQSVLLLAKACQHDFGPACGILGNVLLSAVEEQPDAEMTTTALQFLEHGCELEYADACVELGRVYALARAGVPRDVDRAIAYFKGACDGLKEDDACDELRTLECKEGRRQDCPITSPAPPSPPR